jgi:hypothetical protein
MQAPPRRLGSFEGPATAALEVTGSRARFCAATATSHTTPRLVPDWRLQDAHLCETVWTDPAPRS